MWSQETKYDSLAGLFLNILERQKIAFFQYFTKGTACVQSLSYKKIIGNDQLSTLSTFRFER